MYTLTIEGQGEDEAGIGDLDITDDLLISGTGGAVNAVVDGGGIDRVFHVGELTTVKFENLDIQHGAISSGGLAPLQSGGGIRIEAEADVLLTNVLVANNASDGGGGISNHGTLEIRYSAIIGNASGAISNAGTLTMLNATISGNLGGGFPDTQVWAALANSGTASLTNITISGNDAQSDHAPAVFSPGVLTLKNTIVADNSGGNCSFGIDGQIISAGHNLEDSDTCGFDAEGDITNTDPMLGPLGNIGGLTPGYYLQQGSPAIDAGSPDCPPPATDQRGMTRPQGPVCDIGAYEYKVVTLPIEVQLGDCLDEIDIVWGHDNTSKQWLAFKPGALAELQTLHASRRAGDTSSMHQSTAQLPLIPTSARSTRAGTLSPGYAAPTSVLLGLSARRGSALDFRRLSRLEAKAALAHADEALLADDDMVEDFDVKQFTSGD